MRILNISDNAKKGLRKLDRNSAQRILKKLYDFSQNTDAFEIKKLKSIDNTYRIRIGEYRAIFEYNLKEITVLKIGHRRDVYK